MQNASEASYSIFVKQWSGLPASSNVADDGRLSLFIKASAFCFCQCKDNIHCLQSHIKYQEKRQQLFLKIVDT